MMPIEIHAGPSPRAIAFGDKLAEAFADPYYEGIDLKLTVSECDPTHRSETVLDMTGTVTKEVGIEKIVLAMLAGPYEDGLTVFFRRPQDKEEEAVADARQGLEDCKAIRKVIRHLQEAEKAQAHDGMTVREARYEKLRTARAHLNKLMSEWGAVE